MIGVSAGRLRAYLRAGVLSPEKGTRGELRFSFQDLLLLRKAEGLVSQRIPPHRVRRALKALRERLTDEQPLTGVSLGTDGPQVVVHERGARWQAESGQVLLAFDKHGARRGRGAAGGAADAAAHRLTRPAGDVVPPTVEEMYELGCDLDEADPERAESSYRQVIEQAPHHADAHINLGRILHERGDLARRRGTLPARAGDPPERCDRQLQPRRRARGRRTSRRGARSLPARHRAPTNATPTRTTTRPACTICWATTRRRYGTCASAGTSRANSADEPGRLPPGQAERYLAAHAGELSPSFRADPSWSSMTTPMCVTRSPACWSTRATASPASAAGARR